MPATGSRAGRIVAGNALDDETVFAVATHTDCLNVQFGGIPVTALWPKFRILRGAGLGTVLQDAT